MKQGGGKNGWGKEVSGGSEDEQGAMSPGIGRTGVGILSQYRPAKEHQREKNWKPYKNRRKEKVEELSRDGQCG